MHEIISDARNDFQLTGLPEIALDERHSIDVSHFSSEDR